MNSSAHSPSSDDSASMSPSGVETMARDSCIWLQQSLDQVSDDALLLFDELPDAVVGEIEQRISASRPNGSRFGRALHLDEPARRRS